MTRLYTAGLAALAMSNIAFAAAADKSSGSSKSAPTPVPAPGVATQPSSPPQPAPGVQSANAAGNATIPASAAAAKSDVYLPITADIPLPEKRPSTGDKRGAKSIYPFETLEIGQSFGIKGKTWKNVSSTVASANARYLEPDKLIAQTNPDGSPKMIEADVPGVGRTTVPAPKQPERQFWGCAVDNKTDPQGADVRVWRVPLDDPRLVKRPRKAK